MPFRGKTPFASRLHRRVASLARRPVLAAAVLFTIVLVIALGAWRWASEQSLREANLRFDQRTAHITRDLQHEFSNCDAVLRGARGLLTLSPAVTADAWREYVKQLDLGDTSSVVRALGFADLNAASVARLSAGTVSATGSGAAPQPVAPLTLMAPAVADAMPPGYDLAGTPASRAALLRAIDTGTSALDVGAAPSGETGPDASSHITLYFPVYSDAVLPATPPARAHCARAGGDRGFRPRIR